MEENKKNTSSSLYIKKNKIKPSPTKMVNIRIEENMYEKIKREAKIRGMNIKTYILYCILNHEEYNVIHIDNNVFFELISQIKKIGVNINQMSKNINSGKIKEVNYDIFLEDFKNIENKLDEIISTLRKIN